MKVVAALSGGVDSAVAAARAVAAGHEVVGVHLALGSEGATVSDRPRGCCTLRDRHDAARAADVIGIPFYVWDLSAQFEREVVADFVTEYAAGRTPNPCVRCNEKIKFAAMLERALLLGFDALCTGHYARLVESEAAGVELHRGVDAAKDQSYVLAVLGPEQLARSMFPLGADTKACVRAEAAHSGLLVADKPDSSDICFIPAGDTRAWLTDRIGARSGPIIDYISGERLGTHSGVHSVTVGQRRGLHLTVPAADGRPRYVVSSDAETRTVSVGPAHALNRDQITISDPVWCGPAPQLPISCEVQLRAHGEPVAARVSDRLVRLVDPVRGVAAGQTLVMYAGTRVLGSATITG